MKFTAVVPIKSNISMRENFLLLDNKPLFLYIFETLLETPFIDKVICYCSNKLIKDFLPKDIEFLIKDISLDEDNVYSMDILQDLASKIKTDYFIMCAITSPFIKPLSIVKGIEKILYENYDSAISVEKLSKYAWFLNAPLNNSLESRKRTNQIEPIYTETKGFCIFEKNLISKSNRYIGYNQALIEVSQIEAINVKYNEDIELAQIVAQYTNKEKCNPYFLLSKQCKHLILDMDGVLVDSLELMKEAWSASKGEEFAPFDEYKKLIGLPFDDICLKLGVKKECIGDIKKDYFSFSKKYVNKVKLFDGVKESLEAFKNAGIKISIASSKDYESALNILKYFNIKIDCLVTPNANGYQGRNKPFGDPLLYACFKNQVSTKESIYVGDMISDYQAAKDASIDFIFASYGYGELLMKTNQILNFCELKLLLL